MVPRLSLQATAADQDHRTPRESAIAQEAPFFERRHYGVSAWERSKSSMEYYYKFVLASSYMPQGFFNALL